MEFRIIGNRSSHTERIYSNQENQDESKEGLRFKTYHAKAAETLGSCESVESTLLASAEWQRLTHVGASLEIVDSRHAYAQQDEPLSSIACSPMRDTHLP